MSEAPLETIIATVSKHLTLCLADNSHTVYVAEMDGGLVGYAAVHWVPFLLFTGPEGYISELFISEAARGQGIGSQLLKIIEQEARSRGCSRLGLLNSSERESYKREFYKKQGWEERNSVINFILPLT